MSRVEIVENAGAEQIAGWIAARIEAALDASEGRVDISVPGGSTPFPIFEELVKRDLDFARLRIGAGDDRVVPEDHAASNTGKIRAIFEPVGAEVASPASDDFEPGRYALCWLGMGADGHIASLFPNTDPQVDDPDRVRRLTPDPLPPEAPFDRVTLTIPALLDTGELMFVIRGEDKRAVFDEALAGSHDLPVARLLGEAARRGINVTVFT
ncbi:MAG: 6-phosphogluconolactonase [Erythrobacter sp.]